MLKPRYKPLHPEFVDLVREVIKSRTRGTQRDLHDIADAVSVHYLVVSRWQCGTAPFHADRLAAFCNFLGDYRLLDFLESQTGRKVYPVPTDQELANYRVEDVVGVQALMKEVSEALGEMARTLKDPNVTRTEFKRTSRELNDVIRECARLIHWLDMRSSMPKTRRAHAGR